MPTSIKLRFVHCAGVYEHINIINYTIKPNDLVIWNDLYHYYTVHVEVKCSMIQEKK